MGVAHHHTVGRLWCWRDANSMAGHWLSESFHWNEKWVCLKIVYPYTQWLIIIIPTKWLFIGGIPHFQTYPNIDFLIHATLLRKLHESPRLPRSPLTEGIWGSELQRWQGAWRPNLCIKSKVLHRTWGWTWWESYNCNLSLMRIAISLIYLCGGCWVTETKCDTMRPIHLGDVLYFTTCMMNVFVPDRRKL